MRARGGSLSRQASFANMQEDLASYAAEQALPDGVKILVVEVFLCSFFLSLFFGFVLGFLQILFLFRIML